MTEATRREEKARLLLESRSHHFLFIVWRRSSRPRFRKL